MKEENYVDTGSTYVDTDVDSNLDQGGGADGEAEGDADTYANAEGVSHGGSLSCCCCCFLFSCGQRWGKSKVKGARRKIKETFRSMVTDWLFMMGCQDSGQSDSLPLLW